MRHPCFVLCALALTAGVPAATCAAPAPSGVSPTDIRFAALDGDGDGRVTWEEFHKANESIARQGFDIIDADKNGHISLEEWRAFAANHGMDIAMPSTGTTLPARPVEPPTTPAPGHPSLPLVMPPAGPDEPRPGNETNRPVQPADPAAPDAPGSTGAQALPLIMPPAGNAAGVTPPPVTPPASPSRPGLPVITPPTPSAPAAGVSSEVRQR